MDPNNNESSTLDEERGEQKIKVNKIAEFLVRLEERQITIEDSLNILCSVTKQNLEATYKLLNTVEKLLILVEPSRSPKRKKSYTV